MATNDPRDFRPSPGPGDAAGPARHPPATLRLFPPSLAPGPVYVARPPLALLPDAHLTVKPCGAVTLSKPLLAAVPQLRALGPVDLVPPPRRGGTWHLDARPTAPRRLPGLGKVARFRIAALTREHFLLATAAAGPGSAGTGPGRGTQGTVGTRDRLTFVLGPELVPGYYVLTPAANRSAHQ